MTLCHVLDVIGQTYGARPSEIMAGGQAAASFDLLVRQKAKAFQDGH